MNRHVNHIIKANAVGPCSTCCGLQRRCLSCKVLFRQDYLLLRSLGNKSLQGNQAQEAKDISFSMTKRTTSH